MPIYTRTQKKSIENEQYDKILEKRGLKRIIFYEPKIFKNGFIKKSYSAYEHVWSQGDRLYKLSHTYYEDKAYFWLIGLFNQKPTDAHYKFGDIVYIPADPLEFYRDVV
tara:strand:+ start:83 stop:409 length:327 start_codon:yes stop_codon:yes gene_type:complete